MVNRYEAGAAGQTVESAQGSWAYAAGGSLAFCTDVALRAEGSSLFAVHRATRARSTPGAPLSAAVFSEELSKASAHVRSSFDQWLKQPGPIDVGTCLERAGYAVARPTYRGYTPRALALEILKVPSYDPLDLLVKKVVVGSAFLPGDMIRKLDGVPLFGTASIDWLLRDATPGQQLSFEVRRAGAETTVTSLFPTIGAEARIERVGRVTTLGSGARRSPLEAP